MSELIEWTSDYIIGFSPIDEQHKQMINLINLLITKKEQHEKIVDPAEILFPMVVFTETHFSYEEKLLELIDYKSLKQHKKIHGPMISATRQIIVDYKKRGRFDSEEVYSMLKGWWLNHILNEDMKYQAALLEQNLIF